MTLKAFNTFLVILFALLQYQLWFGQGGIAHAHRLQNRLVSVNHTLKTITTENHHLRADVNELQAGGEAIEERARQELGMIKQGETFVELAE